LILQHPKTTGDMTMQTNQVQYQGHLSDGSGIQAHSATSLYPCVIYQQQVGAKRLHGVLRGMVDTGPVFPEHESAVAFGELLNGMARVVADAAEQEARPPQVQVRLFRDLLGRRVQLALNEFEPFAQVLTERDRAAKVLHMQAQVFNAHPNITSAVAAMAYYLWRDQKYLAVLVAH
jgi:hypothetical protein